MRKIALFLFTLFLLFFQSFSLASLIPQAHAIDGAWNCSVGVIEDNPITSDHTVIKRLIINTNVAIPNREYSIFMDAKDGSGWAQRIQVEDRGESIKANSTRQLIVSVPFDMDGKTTGDHGTKFVENTDIIFWVTPKTNEEDMGSIEMNERMREFAFCETKVRVGEGVDAEIDNALCEINAKGEGLGEMIHLNVAFKDQEYRNRSGQFYVEVRRPPSDNLVGPASNSRIWGGYPASEMESGIALGDYGTPQGPYIFDAGTYEVKVRPQIGITNTCSSVFTISENGITNPNNEYDAGLGLYACKPDTPKAGVYTCYTALGPVETDAEGFIKTVLSLILGLAGGILLIVIILNGYKFMVSQGDPEKIKDAREGIVAAIMGIFLIIFSLTILSIITSNILDIPGFGR